MKFSNLNILSNISKSHIILHYYKNQLIFCNQIFRNFVRKQCNILYKIIIYFADKVIMYYFVRLWINQRNEIKLYKLCMMNLIIETRMWCLSKYCSVIDEKRCIRMLRNMCFHVVNINYEQINNKMRSYILSECQFYKKK